MEDKIKIGAWLMSDYDDMLVLDDGVTAALVPASKCECVDTEHPEVGQCYEWRLPRGLALDLGLMQEVTDG